MLEITINHVKSEYLVDVWCDKEVRHSGTNITYSHNTVLEIIEEVLMDYRK